MAGEQKPKIDFQAKLREAQAFIHKMDQSTEDVRKHRLALEESARQGTKPPPLPPSLARHAAARNESVPRSIPGLAEKLASAREAMKRLDAASDRLTAIVREGAHTPLEQQCDEVYEDVGRKLYHLQQEEVDDIRTMSEEFERESDFEAEEDRREKEGLPPPSYRK
jgi:uncharacterized protein Yka (UPF0111/DUF47 family)